MSDYTYDQQDGNLHTRYSELLRCTPTGIDRVLDERQGAPRVETDSMADGTVRHDMWAQESFETRRLAQCFGLDWPATHIEREFATEILPRVIVHSRPDVVCAGKNAVVDYKTVLDGTRGWRETIKQYYHTSKQRQLRFYAFQLGLHGILIREGVFLCEIWNQNRDTILGHQMIRFPIHLADMAEALEWAKPRIALLASAIETRVAV